MRVSEAIDNFSICHSEMHWLQKDTMFSMEGSAMTVVGKEGLYRGKYAYHIIIDMNQRRLVQLTKSAGVSFHFFSNLTKRVILA